MSSFFAKLHGIPISSSSTLTATSVKQPTHLSTSKPSSDKLSHSALQQQHVKVINKSSNKATTASTDHQGSVRRPEPFRVKVPSAAPLRRSQSASTEATTVSKKRKAAPLKFTKTAAAREDFLSVPSGFKRRRTASPAFRVHRSSSDDETDFSEPVRLFRGETPDDAQRHPAERSMLNPRAGQDVDFMHAKELVCVVDEDSFIPETPENPCLEVVVQLPFAEERFKLLRPKKLDEYHPTGDIVDTVSHLLTYYLPSDVLPPDTSIQDYIYRLSKAIKSPSPEHALPLLELVDDKILSLRPFASAIKSLSHMPRDLLQRICMQCYTRQVSPHLDGLRKYTAFSSTVYGELLFPFLSELFSNLNFSPSTMFVDLGCGVGNCIIQAAGETGCSAIGIEIMDHAAHLATCQIREFESRMRAWGLSHGPITFYHGDFTTHTAIPELVQKADVVLCNNYAFTAELNDALLRLFLDLPEGAKIISLKSFVPVGKDGRVRGGRGGVGEMLRVDRKCFGPGSVSWMPGGGEYFVSTVSRAESNYGTPVSGEI